MAAAPRDRSAALPLLAAWGALIVYASLYPFAGWHWPPGATPAELLRLPWPRYLIGFDIVANLLGYLPLGFMVFVVRARHGAPPRAGVVAALVCAAVLSYGLEATQHLLPQRVPSLLDAVLNTAGAALGAGLAVFCERLGWLGRWRRGRDRWFSRGSAGASALLLLWPVALLFPAPVPLGLGQVGTPLRELLAAGLDGIAAAQPLVDWLAQAPPPAPRLPALVEGLTSALGLLAPCLLGYAATRPQRPRSGIALAAAAVAVGMTTLSTALNFGPEHALAWVTPAVATALAAAALLALAAHRLAPRRAGALAVAALAGSGVLVHAAPADPYFAQSLQGWEQGRFVRFHGVAQWVGRLWPYAALAWLLAQLGRAASDDEASPPGFP
jgi:VanZ family protein